MFNELLFFAHIASCILFVLLAQRIGQVALVTLFSLQAVFANLFVLKQISLFGFIVTPTDVFAIGGLFSLNILREFYGKAVAIKALFCALFSLLLFGVMAKFHLLYLPDPSDSTQEAYKILLSPATRIVLASTAVFFLTQLIDLKLFQALKKRWGKEKLAVRFAISMTFSELLDTILFSFLGLYGLVTEIGHVIFVSYAIKLITLAIITPTIVLTKQVANYESL